MDLYNHYVKATDHDAREVLSLILKGSYTADDQVWRLLRGPTHLYTPEELANLNPRSSSEDVEGGPEVIDGVTQDGFPEEDYEDLRLAILNFASARSIGGGFLRGARAQEEELCRCSVLYPTLLEQPGYYKANREYPSVAEALAGELPLHANQMYTDHIIYSERVCFFRNSKNGPLQRPKYADVITAPAPNLIGIEDNSADFILQLDEIWRRRWRNVLAVASDRMVDRLVLGAWGCGAFCNDPEQVARAFMDVWPEFAGDFETVFAIPSKFGFQSQVNLEVFRQILGGC